MLATYNTDQADENGVYCPLSTPTFLINIIKL